MPVTGQASDSVEPLAPRKNKAPQPFHQSCTYEEGDIPLSLGPIAASTSLLSNDDSPASQVLQLLHGSTQLPCKFICCMKSPPLETHFLLDVVCGGKRCPVEVERFMTTEAHVFIEVQPKTSPASLGFQNKTCSSERFTMPPRRVFYRSEGTIRCPTVHTCSVLAWVTWVLTVIPGGSR